MKNFTKLFNNRIAKLLFLSVFAFYLSLLTGCLTLPQQPTKISRNIAGKGLMSSNKLATYFSNQNKDYDYKSILNMAKTYINECNTEGINSDVAFAQMCLETGYLRFGNLVVPEMHNYCGLGAMDAEHPGEWFKTEEMGIRAHIQHLHAYGTTKDKVLKNPLIDKRYKYVNPRGKAPTVFELAGTWAADREYGKKLDKILSEMEKLL